MATKKQREKLREARMAFDRAVMENRIPKEAENAVLSEEKPEPKKSSTAKKKATTTKKRASQKPKE